MKKYIRTLSLLLTAVLTISITGCGSSDADGAKDRKGLMAAKELSGEYGLTNPAIFCGSTRLKTLIPTAPGTAE